MKKVLMLTALVVLFAVPAMALNIKTSKHNLGTTGDYAYKSTNETQICVFCHTPHNATKNIPLWNRSNPGGPFQLYTASATLNISNGGKGALSANSISRFCLSCHDGVTGLGSGVVNKPSGTINFAGSGNIGGKAEIGTNLTNDHPINFAYDVARTNEGGVASTLKGPASGLTGVRFFKDVDNKDGGGSDMLECGSCHDVHGAGFKSFLRKNNASSSLCLTCHDK